METDETTVAASGSAAQEIELYLAYLVFLFRFEKQPSDAAAAAAWLDTYVTKAQAYNRRTLDLLTARFFFWSAKLAEDGSQYAAIRPALTNALRTATVRQDIETQVSFSRLSKGQPYVSPEGIGDIDQRLVAQLFTLQLVRSSRKVDFADDVSSRHVQQPVGAVHVLSG